MGWFSDSFDDRTKEEPKQGFFENDSAYKDRVYREGKESIIESMTGSAPKQGFFESDDKYVSRIAHEANERLVEKATGETPKQGWFESDESYRERMYHETNTRIIEGATGKLPKQGFFESDNSYDERVAHEANAHIVEAATGSAPKRGFFESEEAFTARINHQSKHIKASSKGAVDNSSNESTSSVSSENWAEPVPNLAGRSSADQNDPYLDDDDDNCLLPAEEPAKAQNNKSRGADDLLTLGELFNLVSELRKQGGRRVRELPDGRIEETYLDGDFSSVSISTCTYPSRAAHAEKERILALIQSDQRK